jgi:hypothetical protein
LIRKEAEWSSHLLNVPSLKTTTLTTCELRQPKEGAQGYGLNLFSPKCMKYQSDRRDQGDSSLISKINSYKKKASCSVWLADPSDFSDVRTVFIHSKECINKVSSLKLRAALTRQQNVLTP